MPLYEFRCQTCHHRFERLLPMSGAEQQHPCTRCAAGMGERVVSRPALLTGAPTGTGRAAYPTSWKQTGGGDAETLRYWRKRIERERGEETRNPELVGLRREEAERRWARQTGEAALPAVTSPGHSHNHSHAHSESPGHAAPVAGQIP